MAKQKRNHGFVFIRLTEDEDQVLTAMEKHLLTRTQLTRGLIAAACEFYRAHGWFSFPVRITPELFQHAGPAAAALAVAEEAAPYLPSPAATPAARTAALPAADRRQLAAEEEGHIARTLAAEATARRRSARAATRAGGHSPDGASGG